MRQLTPCLKFEKEWSQYEGGVAFSFITKQIAKPIKSLAILVCGETLANNGEECCSGINGGVPLLNIVPMLDEWALTLLNI